MSRGFTLIELLIALIVLSLLMLSGSYAYQYMADNWERNKKAFAGQATDYKNWVNVSNALTNMAPKMVRAEEGPNGFYFLGRANGFTGYTFSSVQNPGLPAVFRLFRERSENTPGWQLVYEEAVLGKQILVREKQTLPFNYREVLFKKSDTIEFEYFGWASKSQRASVTDMFSGEIAKPRWFNSFDGIKRQQHPLVIQVIIDDFLWPFVLPDTTLDLDKDVTPTEI